MTSKIEIAELRKTYSLFYIYLISQYNYMKHLSKIIVLILIVPFLTELLTYNMSLTIFFNPIIFISLVIFYGLAVLVIREISVRWNLGLFGIFLIGLWYGLFNEGIIAETVFMTNNVPMSEMFGHYPLIFGINLAFTFFIITWHALHSVLFPILIIDFLFPKSKRKIWLNKYVLSVISFVVIGAWALVFFNNEKINPAYYLIIFYAIILILVGLSNIFKSKKELVSNKIGIKPVFLGLLFIIMFFVGQWLIAKFNASYIFSILYLLVLISTFYTTLKSLNLLSLKPLLLFGIWSYLFHTLISIFSWLNNGEIERLISWLALTIFLLILVYRVNKSTDDIKSKKN